GRFRARFGERVAVLHSALTEAERRDERGRIASGEARVVVGARSAVFAPVPALGVICVDEEHDPSYKQESDPRYDARSVAAKRAPELEVIRLDADAVEKPEQLRDALERFARAERAVLVGTQMVAKGHHFPGVELAAVVDADMGLGLPDFRAEERTFQLITQL